MSELQLQHSAFSTGVTEIVGGFIATSAHAANKSQRSTINAIAENQNTA